MFSFKEKLGIKPLFIRFLVLGFFWLLKILGTTSIDECIDANQQKIDAGSTQSSIFYVSPQRSRYSAFQLEVELSSRQDGINFNHPASSVSKI